jgi:hypothetical protein
MSVSIGDADARLILNPNGAPAIGFPARVTIEAGPLSFDVEVELLGGERFSGESFATALGRMHETLADSALLSTLDCELDLKLTADDRGRVTGEVKILVRPHDIDLRVEYAIRIDQSYLPAMISDLRSDFPGL